MSKMLRLTALQFQHRMDARNGSTTSVDVAAGKAPRVSGSQAGSGKAQGTGSGNDPSTSIKMKTCRVCKTKFNPRTSTQVVCCTACAYAKVSADKARKEAKARRDGLERIKTKAQWMKEAQASFNKFIRARDKAAGHPCISSGRALDWSGNAVDAGHYRSVGSAPHLRFHEDNCHAQSKQDNRYGSGCAVEYRAGLIARIGLVRVEALEADQSVKKYTIDDLRAIKKKYAARARELAKDGL